MLILIAGLALFFAVHSVRMVAPRFRDSQIALNPKRWKALYMVISFVGLGLIIWGWHLFRGEAPQVFNPPSWGQPAALVLVWIALVFLFGSNINMPAGWIKHLIKHPMLIATALWALAHLLSNGDMASLLLFGSFLAYAAISRLAVIKRGDPAPAVISLRGDVVALIAGSVVYAVFVFWLHRLLFGVSPFG